MISKIAYYLIILPFSYLPLWLLYGIGDILYLLLLSVLPYRKKVIIANIERVFPKLSNKEKKALVRKFYRYFSNLLMESVKGLSISKASLLKRVTVENPEVMEELYAEGKDVLFVGGHYNNWEWLILIQDALFSHKAIGVGKPLSNGFFNKKMNARRERYGMTVTNNKALKACFKQYLNSGNPAAVLLLADQSPGDSLKSYWMQFLGNLTPVLYGPEYLAVNYNTAVVYYEMKKISRGYYRLYLKVLEKDPRSTTWGEITEKHAREMEATILNHPEFWIWSHKRWKRTIPEDLEGLKEQQKEKFNQLIQKIK
ncbi:lysophospholipid acyltransferase family protein [Lishizhenia sp.]|uniref:lysophospholipid acyltransferase family protein n=1 Tax=Lishizhenia sp. TaxID=2497594 RepID=UPI00299DD015|nr:lysophospholipid acyltransferase family protein [Lishizhenia sp.]MDX1445013.1 lysophospholipid acyltransferase family protein [Lishizhenia sp.]